MFESNVVKPLVQRIVTMSPETEGSGINSASDRHLPAAAGRGALEPQDEEWVVEELLNLQTTNQSIEGLVTRGYTQSIAEQSVSDLVGRPVFRAAARLHKANRKLTGLLRAMGELYVHSGFEIQRVRISGPTFYQKFFFTNRPVILQGLMDDWPAVEQWTAEYFKTRYGETIIEVSAERESDRDYELNHLNHRARMRMADYVDRITSVDSSNDCYLVARGHVLDMPEMRNLHADFHCPEGFLDPDSSHRPYVRLWLGPAGTLTSLHCDDCNILFGQVTGSKRVRLIPPYFYASLYNTAEYSSAVDLDNVDLARFPAMRDVPVLELVLEAGEFLFIPVGWWHWVKSLEVSSSLTFTNFYNDSPPVMWPELLE